MRSRRLGTLPEEVGVRPPETPVVVIVGRLLPEAPDPPLVDVGVERDELAPVTMASMSVSAEAMSEKASLMAVTTRGP